MCSHNGSHEDSRSQMYGRWNSGQGEELRVAMPGAARRLGIRAREMLGRAAEAHGDLPQLDQLGERWNAELAPLRIAPST
jgi:hypothetical protein